MATFAVRCPRCQASYQVDDARLGEQAPCAQCHQPFVLTPLTSGSKTRSSPWPWVSDGAVTVASPGEGRPATEEAVPPTWQPGDVILGLYEVRETFTGGGRGLVYRVRHRGWDLDLAVKCPRPECFRSEQDKEDFEREAETWVKLGLHPHAVTCYYVRRLGGIPRVFAEYVAGGSLHEWVHTKRLYAGGPAEALERMLDVAIQFAWGLQHAHEQGLIHRDVKPGNVLLTPEGIAKVTDFGMARARGAPTDEPAEQAHGSILVSAGGMTPAFCSPEQAEGRPVSRKTDVWSWAVSVLAMFAGGAWWSAGSLAAGALQDYLRRSPSQEGPPRMPPDLVELLRHCFQSDPDARPRDMPAIVATLLELYAEVTGSPYRREAPPAPKVLAEGLNNRALSLIDLHKLDEAERLWEEALTNDPGHPESAYNLGLTRWRAGRMDDVELVQRLREIAAGRPGEWLPAYLLAQVEMEQGGWAAAAEALERVAGAGVAEVRAALAAAREQQAEPEGRVHSFAGHANWVSAVAATPDGRYAVSGSADGTLKLWDVSSGRCLRTLRGHTEWVTAVRLSADGRRALSGSADGTLKVWDTATGHCLQTLPGHTSWVLAVDLSPDGRQALSAGGDGVLHGWALSTGKCLGTFEGHAGPVLAVALSADGDHALSAGRDKTLQWWSLAQARCLRSFTGHDDKVNAVALSADGRRALSGSADRTLRLWDTATGHCLCTLVGHAGAVTAVALSPDGRLALSGGDDRTLKLWRLATGRCLATLTGHEGGVNAVCLLAGERQALSASADRTLALWRLPRDHVAPYVLSRVLPSETAVAVWADYERALARARQAAASGDTAEAARWVRAARARPGFGRRPEAMSQWGELCARMVRQGLQGGWEGGALAGHAGPVNSVCLRADGRQALSGGGDRTLRLWDVATGRCLRVFEGHFGPVTSVALSRDGRLAVSGGVDAELKVWDVATGRCLATSWAQTDLITSVSVSADGRLALTGSADGSVLLWQAATGRRLRAFARHTDPVHSVCLSPDGRLALSGGAQFFIRNRSERLFTSGQLRLWDTVTGRPLPTLDGHLDAVTAVSLSFDGRYALSGGGESVLRPNDGRFSQSGQVHLWETATGRHVRTFSGHTDAVTSVCPSFDGRHVLSGSADRTVRLWEVSGGRCLAVFAGHADAVTSVALSADCRLALSAGADGTIKVWVLDWQLADPVPADWDEGARPFLETFLALHTPYAAALPPVRRRTVRELVQSPLSRLFRPEPTEEDVTLALTRRGKAVWTERDLRELLSWLGCAGYGGLRPEGVLRKLERMARTWKGPPELPQS
jgi:WD40 repeat protein/serine/threonine protein kinase